MSIYNTIEFSSEEATRKITVIKTGETTSQRFYESSGTSSGFKDTYFPFEGITDKDSKKPLDRATLVYQGGHAKYIKPSAPTPDELRTTYKPLIEVTGLDATNKIWQRFKNIECMVISSVIGGGIWNDDKGIALKKMLEQTQPDLYKKYPKVELSEEELKLDVPGEVNKWTKSRHEEYKHLSLETSSAKENQPSKTNEIQATSSESNKLQRQNAMPSTLLLEHKKQLRLEKLAKFYNEQKKTDKKLPPGVTRKKSK